MLTREFATDRANAIRARMDAREEVSLNDLIYLGRTRTFPTSANARHVADQINANGTLPWIVGVDTVYSADMRVLGWCVKSGWRRMNNDGVWPV